MGMNKPFVSPSASNLQDPDGKPTKSRYAVSVSFRVPVSESNRRGDKKKPKSVGFWPTVRPFVNVVASDVLATCVIQPIDMTKVRIQLGHGSAVQVAKNMLKEEGFGALYKGLSAALLRQVTYNTAAIGTFKLLSRKAIEANDGKPLTYYQKQQCWIPSLAIGACVASPADLALLRMQADYTLPAAQRRNYKNAFHALYRIVEEEGVLALWKGAGPTVVRTMSSTIGRMTLYHPSEKFFKDNVGFGKGATLAAASFFSVSCAAALALPFDYIKTQVQKMQPDAEGKFPYTGCLDCGMKTFNAGGIFKFYTGFPVYCLRTGPHFMIQLFFLLQIRKIEKEFGL